MARYDWSDQLGRITRPTLVVVRDGEPIDSAANYEPFRRSIKDVEMRVYEGAPHNICDAFPDRCAGDVLDFLGRRFGLGLKENLSLQYFNRVADPDHPFRQHGAINTRHPIVSACDVA